MSKTNLIRAAAMAIIAFSLASFATAAMAEAKIVTFKGTRDQVAAACTAIGVEASNWTSNGSGYTGCANPDKGTSVSCNDKGDCIGEVPRLVGQLNLRGILAGTFTAAPALPPASLSESGPSEVPVPYSGAGLI